MVMRLKIDDGDENVCVNDDNDNFDCGGGEEGGSQEEEKVLRKKELPTVSRFGHLKCFCCCSYCCCCFCCCCFC